MSILAIGVYAEAATSNWNMSGSGIVAVDGEGEHAISVFPREPLDVGTILLEITLNAVTVIVVIGQRGVYIRQGDAGMVGDDFRRRLAPVVVFDDDVLDTDAMADDARFPAADARRRFDVL